MEKQRRCHVFFCQKKAKRHTKRVHPRFVAFLECCSVYDLRAVIEEKPQTAVAADCHAVDRRQPQAVVEYGQRSVPSGDRRISQTISASVNVNFFIWACYLRWIIILFLLSRTSRFRFFANRSTVGEEIIREEKKKSEPVSHWEDLVRISWVWYECSKGGSWNAVTWQLNIQNHNSYNN